MMSHSPIIHVSCCTLLSTQQRTVSVAMNATELVIHVVYKTLFSSLWLAALLLNVFNIALLARTVQRRSTWSNILLLSLSASDCFLVATGGTIAVAAFFRTTLLKEFIGLCYFQGFSLNLCISFSNILVAFIAIDRYIAVLHPFCYNKKILNQRPALLFICIALSLLAIGSAVLAGIPFSHSPSYEPLQPPVFCWPPFSHETENSIDSNRIEYVVHIIVKICLVLVVLICSTCTCIKLFMEQRVLRSIVRDGLDSGTGNSVQVNLGKLTAAIAIIFFMCTLPYLVVIFLHVTTIYSNPSTIISTFLMVLSSTLLDPLLYVLVKVTIRRAYIETLKTILYGLCCCKKTYKPNGIDFALGLTRSRNTTIGRRVPETSHGPQSASASTQALAGSYHSPSTNRSSRSSQPTSLIHSSGSSESNSPSFSTQALAGSIHSPLTNQSSGRFRPTSPIHSSELRSLCSSTQAVLGSDHSLSSQSLSDTQLSEPSPTAQHTVSPPQPYLVPKRSHTPRSLSSKSFQRRRSHSRYPVSSPEERLHANLSTISERSEPKSNKKEPIVKKVKIDNKVEMIDEHCGQVHTVKEFHKHKKVIEKSWV